MIEGTTKSLEALIKRGLKFPLIYADPPWAFRVWSLNETNKMRTAENHYNGGTMTIEQIKQMPVKQLAAKNCALVLWAVSPDIPGALDVMKAWGFEYVTVAFTWVKQSKSQKSLHVGMGYYTRANPEICLLGKIGAPKRLSKEVQQLVLAPIGRHSHKPMEVAQAIERLFPGPYLEMFSRQARKGWVSFGDEVQRDIFTKNLPELDI